MTDVDARPRRRFTWSVSALGNRFAYAFLVAIAVQIAFGYEPFSLVIGVAVFALLTGYVLVRRHYAGTDRQP